jgi:cysteinyl-tRNA synthetase
VLRALVVRLGDLATVGVRDPRELVGPYVEALLELRSRARAARDYGLSDLVRDRLGAAGVEVRDTPEGAQWVLAGVGR